MIKKLFIPILIVFPQLLLGQIIEKDEVHRRVVITKGDSVIEATILKVKSGIKGIKPNLNYYWYENNQIHCNQGGFSGWLLDGECHIYTLDEHALIGSGWYKSGLKDGVWKTWNGDGRLTERVNWENGLIDGERFQYQDGSLCIYEQYKKGVLNGKTWILNPDGSTTEKHYLNGKEKEKRKTFLGVGKNLVRKSEKTEKNVSKASQKKQNEENTDKRKSEKKTSESTENHD